MVLEWKEDVRRPMRGTLLVLSAAVTLLAGCTAPLRPEVARQTDRQHIVQSNYTIGAPLTVNVGEPLIKVQDYWQDQFDEPMATATKSFKMTGGPVELTFIANQSYRVRGRIAVDGKDYSVVSPEGTSPAYQAALVADDGVPLTRVAATNPGLNGDHVFVAYTFKIDPPDARLERKSSVRVDTSKGFVNYEVLYTGISENAINMTYREFSPDGLARVAFFQNLTYPRTAATITFRQIRLAIQQVTPESITARVISDGR